MSYDDYFKPPKRDTWTILAKKFGRVVETCWYNYDSALKFATLFSGYGYLVKIEMNIPFVFRNADGLTLAEYTEIYNNKINKVSVEKVEYITLVAEKLNNHNDIVINKSERNE